MPTRTFNGHTWRYDNGVLGDLLSRIEILENDGFEYRGTANLAVIGVKPVVPPIPIPPDPNPIPPDPIPPNPNPTLLFENGWDNANAADPCAVQLLDRGAWTSYGPDRNDATCAQNLAQVAIIPGMNGSPTRALQINFRPHLNSDGTPVSDSNGPDVRVTKAFGSRPEIYAGWEYKTSNNWLWASADHKVAILGANDAAQDYYYNVRGNGNGPIGRPVIYVTSQDTMYSDPDVQIRAGEWGLYEIHIVNGGRIEAKYNGRLLNLRPEAGSGSIPIAGNNGVSYLKLDTTYNRYAYPSGLGLTMQSWYNNVKVSTQGWTR